MNNTNSGNQNPKAKYEKYVSMVSDTMRFCFHKREGRWAGDVTRVDEGTHTSGSESQLPGCLCGTRSVPSETGPSTTRQGCLLRATEGTLRLRPIPPEAALQDHGPGRPLRVHTRSGPSSLKAGQRAGWKDLEEPEALIRRDFPQAQGTAPSPAPSPLGTPTRGASASGQDRPSALLGDRGKESCGASKGRESRSLGQRPCHPFQDRREQGSGGHLLKESDRSKLRISGFFTCHGGNHSPFSA